MKTNSVYLHHILDSIAKIETYLAGYTHESFLNMETKFGVAITMLLGMSTRE